MGNVGFVLKAGVGCASGTPHSRIAVLADTHLRDAPLPTGSAWVENVRSADLILHAGDVVSLQAFQALEGLGVPLVAVRGNVDEAELAELLPDRFEVALDGVSIGLVHDAGPSQGRLQRLRKWFPSADAVVFGHSHVPLLEFGSDGFQIFNPGSPTAKRRQRHPTLGLASVHEGTITFEHVVLDAGA
jgi:putative phosphoesterase